MRSLVAAAAAALLLLAASAIEVRASAHALAFPNGTDTSTVTPKRFKDISNGTPATRSVPSPHRRAAPTAWVD